MVHEVHAAHHGERARQSHLARFHLAIRPGEGVQDLVQAVCAVSLCRVADALLRALLEALQGKLRPHGGRCARRGGERTSGVPGALARPKGKPAEQAALERVRRGQKRHVIAEYLARCRPCRLWRRAAL